MGLAIQDAKAKIDEIFEVLGTVGQTSVLPSTLEKGKVYEAWVLAELLSTFSAMPGTKVRLVNGSKLVLKSSAGPINRDYPYFSITRVGRQPLEAWTDVEFSTLSFAMRGGSGWPDVGDRHELDIVFVPSNLQGYPTYESLVWGVECKNTSFEKSLARAALGVRRELSFLQDPQQTDFDGWPRQTVPASPASVLSVYSTSSKVSQYADAGAVFGVDFNWLPM